MARDIASNAVVQRSRETSLTLTFAKSNIPSQHIDEVALDEITSLSFM